MWIEDYNGSLINLAAVWRVNHAGAGDSWGVIAKTNGEHYTKATIVSNLSRAAAENVVELIRDYLTEEESVLPWLRIKEAIAAARLPKPEVAPFENIVRLRIDPVEVQ